MSDTQTLQNSERRVTPIPERNLDVLRAIAVLGVVIDHWAAAAGVSSGFTNWLGGAGVQSFFVHTCLVLMASLERDDAPRRSGWVRRFYVRRAFRIYPLAWVIIAVMVIWRVPPAGLDSTYHAISKSTLFANLALAQDLAGRDNILIVLWTLPLELQMYVVLPFCFLVALHGSRARMALLIAAGLGLAYLFAYNAQVNAVELLGRMKVLRNVPSFLMGVFAYWSLRRRPNERRLLPSWTWLPVVLVNIVVFYLPRSTMGGWWGVQAAYCAVLGITIPWVRDASKTMFTAAAKTIATYSYGIYLIHLLAIRVGFGLLPDQSVVLRTLAFLAVLSLACWAAYHGVERPGIRFGQWLVARRSRSLPLESTAPAP